MDFADELQVMLFTFKKEAKVWLLGGHQNYARDDYGQF
jgi:hypothetical protein